MKNATKRTKRTSNLSVLYIESNLSLQEEISTHLKKIFSKVYQAYNGQEGLDQAIQNKPDLIVTDLNLSKKNSFEMIIDIQAQVPEVSIIVLSYKNSDFNLLETLDLGIVALLQKPLQLNNFNKALQKVILLKPNKIEVAKPKEKSIPQKESKIEKIKDIPFKSKMTIPEKIKRKPIKPAPLKKEPIAVKKEVIRTLPEKKKEEIQKPIPTQIAIKKPIVKAIVPKKVLQVSCETHLLKAMNDKTKIICINSYKGLIINNEGILLKVQENVFTVQISKTQLVSVIYERQMIINIGKYYIQAKLIEIDKKRTSVTLANAQIIDYKERDATNKRITVDKSFKASIDFNNTHIELTPIDLSYRYISLETKDLFQIKVNTSIDLTMGFEIDGPSSLINEKKFTKVFATGTIKRIQNFNGKQKIIIEHLIQKSGQNVYKKYLQQRELSIINEFRMKLKQ